MLEDLLFDELLSEEKQYMLVHRGHTVVAAVEIGSLGSARLRLFVDGRLIDTKSTISTTARIPAELPGHGRRHRIEIKATLGLLGGVKSCVLVDDGVEYAMPPHKGRAQRPPRGPA